MLISSKLIYKTKIVVIQVKFDLSKKIHLNCYGKRIVSNKRYNYKMQHRSIFISAL